MADGTRRTTFRLLLDEIRDSLAKNMRLAPEKIFRSIKKLGDLRNIKSTQFIILRPGNGTVDGVWHDSEGRLCVAVERELIVEPYLQLSVDDVTAADRIAYDFMGIEDQIVNIIDIYEPENALEPIHYLGVSAEEGDQTPGWATTSLRFSVKFLQAVNQSRQ